MKRHLFFAVAALVAMVSCRQENGPLHGAESSEGRREVTVVANASETKTTLSENDEVLWEAGDAVRLLFTHYNAHMHTEDFTTAAAGATATFTGTIPNDVVYLSDGSAYKDDLYMVYPSTAMDSQTGAVSFELPAQQSVAAGTFPTGMNLSSALASFEDLCAEGTVNATFLNAFAIIRFELPANVASLKITGTSPLAGDAALKFDSKGRLVVDSWTEQSNSVTLTPAASAGSFTEGETYNILVYPGQHSSISVELTDVDNCTYSKTVTKSFDFAAANYYTFNFNTDFGKDFTFTVSGVNVPENEKVNAVFTAADSEIYAKEAVVANSQFSVRLPHDVVPASAYAVYPSTAYSDGKVTYNLSATGELSALYLADLPLDGGQAEFKSVATALATMKFTVPAGVSKVTVNSSVAFAGNAEITLAADGTVTAGTGDQTELTLESVEAGDVVLNVYPFSGANITITLADAAGAVNVQTFDAQTVAAGAALSVALEQNVEFSKNGSFGNENFASGGDTIEF